MHSMLGKPQKSIFFSGPNLYFIKVIFLAYVILHTAQWFDFVQVLSPDEFFNVLKLQNGVECTKDEVVYCLL